MGFIDYIKNKLSPSEASGRVDNNMVDVREGGNTHEEVIENNRRRNIGSIQKAPESIQDSMDVDGNADTNIETISRPMAGSMQKHKPSILRYMEESGTPKSISERAIDRTNSSLESGYGRKFINFANSSLDTTGQFVSDIVTEGSYKPESEKKKDEEKKKNEPKQRIGQRLRQMSEEMRDREDAPIPKQKKGKNGKRSISQPLGVNFGDMGSGIGTVNWNDMNGGSQSKSSKNNNLKPMNIADAFRNPFNGMSQSTKSKNNIKPSMDVSAAFGDPFGNTKVINPNKSKNINKSKSMKPKSMNLNDAFASPSNQMNSIFNQNLFGSNKKRRGGLF